MKRLAVFALGLLIGATSGQAQSIAEGVDLSTESGQIAILDSADGFSRVLRVGDRRFFEDGGYRYVSVEAQRGALYLIGVASGGTACPSLFVWLHTEGGAPRVTETFGNCSDLPGVSSDAETVTVTLPSSTAADGFVSFVYDGKTIDERVVGQRVSGVGPVAEDWIGRYPFEVFRDADWRGPLVALMGEADYRRAGDVIATSSPFEAEGDWVTGTGFNSRIDGARGAIALNRRDGRAVVAIRTDARGLEMWGNPGGTIPPGLLSVLQSR